MVFCKHGHSLFSRNEVLLSEVDKLEQLHELGNRNGELHHKPLGETRTALEKLISRMDNLEATFDKMAEKTSTLLN